MAKVTNNSGYSYATNYTKNLKIFEKNIDKNNNIVALIKLMENKKCDRLPQFLKSTGDLHHFIFDCHNILVIVSMRTLRTSRSALPIMLNSMIY